MPSRGKSTWVKYVCLGANNKPLADDLANHTLYWTKDNTRAEAVNCQQSEHVELGHGLYNILITNGESDCDEGSIDGESSTPGAIIVPRIKDFFDLPAITPGMADALPLLDDHGALPRDVLKNAPVAGTLLGVGAVAVTENYGGDGEYRVIDLDGSPVSEAWVRAFTMENWEHGNRTNEYMAAQTITDTAGNWLTPLMLDPGEYVLIIFKKDVFRTTLVNLIVE